MFDSTNEYDTLLQKYYKNITGSARQQWNTLHDYFLHTLFSLVLWNKWKPIKHLNT